MAESSILNAVLHNEIDKVREIVEQDPTTINTRGSDNLLHQAAYKGYKEICELLIKSGLDVNSIDENHATPLHYASCAGQTSICEFLIDECKANIEAKNNRGETAFFYAVLENRIDSAKLFIARKANIEASLLRQSIINQNKEMRELLETVVKGETISIE